MGSTAIERNGIKSCPLTPNPHFESMTVHNTPEDLTPSETRSVRILAEGTASRKQVAQRIAGSANALPPGGPGRQLAQDTARRFAGESGGIDEVDRIAVAEAVDIDATGKRNGIAAEEAAEGRREVASAHQDQVGLAVPIRARLPLPAEGRRQIRGAVAVAPGGVGAIGERLPGRIEQHPLLGSASRNRSPSIPVTIAK